MGDQVCFEVIPMGFLIIAIGILLIGALLLNKFIMTIGIIINTNNPKYPKYSELLNITVLYEYFIHFT